MSSVAKLVLKTIVGAVWGALVFLGLGSLKEFFFTLYTAISTDPSSFSLLPLSILAGAFFLFWLGGDFVLIASLIGAEVAFLKNLPKFIQVQERIYRVIFLLTVIITVFAVFIKIETIFQIRSTYSTFCSSVSKEDYRSAYDFFTPEYQSHTDFHQFVQKMNDYSAHVNGCHRNDGHIKFMSSFLNTGSVFPYHTDSIAAPFSNFLQEPELPMKKISGEWLFTGEENWYYLP